MANLVWDFNKFMSKDYKSLSMGLTPSGHLHLGFLSTLACALMYLKEHKKAHLIITTVENSLAFRMEKYNGIPLRFQYIEEDDLIVPTDYKQLKKRNLVERKIHSELNNLIWKLVQIFDSHTKEVISEIKHKFIPPKHKKFLELKEHKIYHLFGTQIYTYSFLRILEHDQHFKRKLIKYLTDPEFAKVVSPLCGLTGKIKSFENQIIVGSKKYQPISFQIPIRLYCPNCHQLCSEWAAVVLGSPKLGRPTLAAKCKNTTKCPRAAKVSGYDGYVYHELKDSLDMAEFHFMLDPMRDFFDPFKAECHIFGGDYFQLEYTRTGLRAVDKIKNMFDYLESKTGQKKDLFGGPLIAIGGSKMSKSGRAFNIKNIKNIKPIFLNIIKILEDARANSYPNGMKIEYEEIIRKTKN